MRGSSFWLLVVSLTVGCAGTDPATPNNTNGTTSNNGTSANSTPNNSTSNATPNAAFNNTTPNATPNNATNNGTTGTTGNTTNPNNATPEWRALVANADLTGDTSTWNVVVFDGTTASVTVPQEFGSGSLAVAAGGGLGFVVDLDTGTTLIIDGARGTIDETIELGDGPFDSVAASSGTLVAASGAQHRIAQYSVASGALGSPIPLPPPTGSSLYVRSLSIDGDRIAGVSEESAMFPTTPQVFVADVQTAALVDADPATAGVQTIGLTGATRIDGLGGEAFAVGTASNGIVVLREVGGGWTVDQPLIAAGEFSSAEVQGVAMATQNDGIAFVYDTEFGATVFDATSGATTAVSGLSLPTALIGGDASSDGRYYFVGDYGIRNQADAPWGVGVVDASGAVMDFVMTDDMLPPKSIAALN